jgi:hypothetical protein
MLIKAVNEILKNKYRYLPIYFHISFALTEFLYYRLPYKKLTIIFYKSEVMKMPLI